MNYLTLRKLSVYKVKGPEVHYKWVCDSCGDVWTTDNLEWGPPHCSGILAPNGHDYVGDRHAQCLMRNTGEICAQRDPRILAARS